MVGNYRPFGDHLLTNGIKKFWSANGLQMVGNYRPFGDHLPTNDIKKFWSENGLQMVGNYRPFGDHLPTKIFRLVNGRKIGGNGLSVNGREMVDNLPTN